jgi:hypothetical protein
VKIAGFEVVLAISGDCLSCPLHLIL